MNRRFRWLPFTLLTLLLAGTALSQCKSAPVLTVSYEGGGMTLQGKHLYLLVCASGDIEYDSGKFDGHGWLRPLRIRLTPRRQAELLAFLDDNATRSLTGRYSGVVGVRDHFESVEVTVSRPEGRQNFTANDFYGATEKTYPPSLIAFLCGIDKLRTETDWHISDALVCPSK